MLFLSPKVQTISLAGVNRTSKKRQLKESNPITDNRNLHIYIQPISEYHLFYLLFNLLKYIFIPDLYCLHFVFRQLMERYNNNPYPPVYNQFKYTAPPFEHCQIAVIMIPNVF